MSGYLKLKVIEGRKLNSPYESLKPDQLRPIIHIKCKYENETTEPSQVSSDSTAKWGEMFDFRIYNYEEYFIINVYNEEIKKENILGEVKIGFITFKEQKKVDSWFPFYFIKKKKYQVMGELHIIGKFYDENEYDEEENDSDFFSEDSQNNIEINNENEYSYANYNNGSECSFTSNNNNRSEYSFVSNNNNNRRSEYSFASNNNNNNRRSEYSFASNNNNNNRRSEYSFSSNNNESVYSHTSNNNRSGYSNTINDNGNVYSRTSNNNGSIYSNANSNINRSEASNANNNNVSSNNNNDVAEDDEEAQLALALQMSLEEEKMRQEATRSGLISNNEDFILAKVLEMSMDDAVKSNLYFPKSNVSRNVVGSPENSASIAFENDIDEDEQYARAIALSLAEININNNN